VDTTGMSAALRRMLRIGGNPLCFLPFGPALVEWLNKESCNKVYRLLDDTISRRLKDSGPKDREDLLDVIIRSSRDAKDEFAAERDAKWVRDQVQLLFVAGSDTTGSTLCWALPLLATHPDIQQKLKDEVRTSLRNKDSFPGEFERYSALSYTEAFIKEVLRLYPPAGVARALNNEEKEFRGISMKQDPDATLGSNPFLAHRREEYFPQPYRFYPERWLTPGMADNEAFASFGYGFRLCLGKSFAMLEMKVVLAKLLEGHTIRALDEKQPFPEYGLQGQMRGPVGEYPLVIQRDAAAQ
jgi:cytochrome P450